MKRIRGWVVILYGFFRFRAQEMMIDEFDYHQDIHSSAWFVHLATSRWFGVYLDWIVVVYLSCCVLSFLLMPSGNLFTLMKFEFQC